MLSSLHLFHCLCFCRCVRVFRSCRSRAQGDTESRQGKIAPLPPHSFDSYFAMLLKHAVCDATEGVHHPHRSDGRLFNLAHLRSKTKVCKGFVRDRLFTSDAATHTLQELRALMDLFSWSRKLNTSVWLSGWRRTSQVKTQRHRGLPSMENWQLEREQQIIPACTTKISDIDIKSWEALTADCTGWRSTLHQHLKIGDQKLDRCCSRQDGQQKRVLQCKQT